MSVKSNFREKKVQMKLYKNYKKKLYISVFNAAIFMEIEQEMTRQELWFYMKYVGKYFSSEKL